MRAHTTLHTALVLVALAGSASAQCASSWIVASDRGDQDHFGRAVALSSGWVAVGAPYDDNPKGSGAGAVYLFQRTGNSASQVFKALPSNAAAEYHLGRSVSMDETHMIFGGQGVYNAGPVGIAYIYRFVGGNWIADQGLAPATLVPGDDFGAAVAIHGNVAVVGAPGDADQGENAGRAYFYRLVGNTWSLTGFPSIPDSQGAYFGVAVATHSERIAVGSPYEDYTIGATTYEGAGQVYIFQPNGNGWEQTQALAAPGAQAYQSFGTAIDMDANLMVIGAPGQDQGAMVGSGVVLVYERNVSTNDWELVQQITAPVPAIGQNFGIQVALDGNDLLCKSLWEDVVYHYRRDSSDWFTLQGILTGGAESTPAYGDSIAVSTGMIAVGDGLNDLGTGPSNSGAVNLTRISATNGADKRLSALPLSLPASTSGCTANATPDGSSTCGLASNSPDVWYRIQSFVTGTLTVTTQGSSYDTVLSLHDPAGASLACNDDGDPSHNSTSRITLPISAGQSVSIRVAGYSGASGAFNLQARVGCRADLSTTAIPGATYGVPNGVVNNDDFFYYLAEFAAGNLAQCDMTTTAVPGSVGYGTPNAMLNNDDFFYYLSRFAAGC